MPFATHSLSSVLAVLCHRIEGSCRKGREEGTTIRALRKARDTLDRLAIFGSQWLKTIDFKDVVNKIKSIDAGCFLGRHEFGASALCRLRPEISGQD